MGHLAEITCCLAHAAGSIDSGVKHSAVASHCATGATSACMVEGRGCGALCGARRLDLPTVPYVRMGAMWHGRFERRLVRSTASPLPAVLCAHTGASLVRPGGAIVLCGARRCCLPAVLCAHTGASLAWPGGDTPCAEHGVSASWLCCAHIRTLPWYSWVVVYLVRSTVHRPPGRVVRPPGHAHVAVRVRAAGAWYAMDGFALTLVRWGIAHACP